MSDIAGERISQASVRTQDADNSVVARWRWFVMGFFGAGNFGDELFAKLLVEQIAEYGYAPPVLYTKSDSVSRRSIQVPFSSFEGFLLNKSFLRSPVRNLVRLSECNGVLMGGGGLFNDVYSQRGLLGYLTLIALARCSGQTHLIHGIEVGSMRSSFMKRLVAWVVRNSTATVCRDAQSAERLRNWTGGSPKVEIGEDLSHDFFRQWFAQHPRTPERNRMAFINAQHSVTLAPDVVAEIVRDLQQSGYRIEVYCVTGAEEKFFQQLAADGVALDFVTPQGTPVVDWVLDKINRSDVVVSERFHFTLAAFHSQADVIVFVSQNKVKDFCERFGGVMRLVPVKKELQNRPETIEGRPLRSREEVCELLARRVKTHFQNRIQNPPQQRVGFFGRLEALGVLLTLLVYAPAYLVNHLVVSRLTPGTRGVQYGKVEL